MELLVLIGNAVVDVKIIHTCMHLEGLDNFFTLFFEVTLPIPIACSPFSVDSEMSSKIQSLRACSEPALRQFRFFSKGASQNPEWKALVQGYTTAKNARAILLN